jgi:hypothetical protein
MKKTIAIVLLIIHVFNLAGYHALFAFLQQKASTQIIEQLDNGAYQTADLVEVKIPYPLPYAANWPDYQRFDGEVDINGMHYNYVKRKMSNDTLYLLCIPNREKTKLAAAKNDYFNAVNEVTNPSQEKKSPSNSLQKTFGTTEYNNLIENYSLTVPANPFAQVHPSVQPILPNQFISSPFQPPKA